VILHTKYTGWRQNDFNVYASTGVTGVWYPTSHNYNGQMTNCLWLPPPWQTVIRASKTAQATLAVDVKVIHHRLVYFTSDSPYKIYRVV
jgi:hypothetical protein